EQPEPADPGEREEVQGAARAPCEGAGARDHERALGEAHLASGEVGAGELGAQRGDHSAPPPSDGAAPPSVPSPPEPSPSVPTSAVSGRAGRRSAASAVVP